MVLPEDLAHHSGALHVGTVPDVVRLVHREEHAPVHGLQPVPHVGQRAPHDHAHRVIEVGAAHLLFQADGESFLGELFHESCCFLSFGAAGERMKFYQLKTFRTTGFAIAFGRFSLWKFVAARRCGVSSPASKKLRARRKRTACPRPGGSLEQAETCNWKRRPEPARLLRHRPRTRAAASAAVVAGTSTRTAPGHAG